jgi:hypothetical protein
MTGYFSRLADRSGITKTQGGAHIRPAAHTEHTAHHRNPANEAIHDVTEQNTVALTRTDEGQAFAKSEPQPDTACTSAPWSISEQAGDRTPHGRNGPDPGHAAPPLTHGEHHATGQQATDLSEAATTHQAHPDRHSSLARVDSSATVPATTLSAGRTEAESQPEAGLPVTHSAIPQIQRTSIAPVVPTFTTETHTSQVPGEQDSSLGGGQAVPGKDRYASSPENAESFPGASERATPPANAVNDDNASASARRPENPLSTAHLLERAATNSPNHRGLTDNTETSTARPVEIRINTLSFEIRHDPTTKTEPPRLNDRIETQKPYRAAPHSRPQTPAHRLSRHYLRGY